MQAVPASEMFTYPRKNCWPLPISKDLYLYFPYLHSQSPLLGLVLGTWPAVCMDNGNNVHGRPWTNL